MNESNNTPTYIVGIGASAGGLEALEKFFKHTERDERLAYVVVQHLSPNFKSLMDDLLAQYTDLRILRVRDGMPVESNSIYLIPPKMNMTIKEGVLHLEEQKSHQKINLPINIFFRSLAAEKEKFAIAVVLSGNGTDGTEGALSIHDYDGLVIAQEPDTAAFTGMPNSVLQSGVVNFTALPEEMPLKIQEYLRAEGSLQQMSELDLTILREENALSLIFGLLRRRYQIDFGEYKVNTMLRRIERRIHFSESGDISNYLNLLREDSDELDHLFRDLLVEVTHFFRDQEAFKYVSTEVVPKLVEAAAETDRTVRVWVPGCATGEEAYSLAILFHEYLLLHKKEVEIKIFATDVHQASLDYGSRGTYSAEKMESIPTYYQDRYFVPEGDRWTISREVRKMVIFAQHNLIQDPPFTRLNFVTCRNVLIYFRPTVQKKVLGNFHFALKKDGVLFLGPSENTGDLNDEFDILSRRWRVYVKRRDVKLPANPGALQAAGPAQVAWSDRVVITQSSSDYQPTFTRTDPAWQLSLLNRYIPAGFLVNVHLEAVHIFGDAGRYLAPSAGKVSFNLLSMLQGPLQSSIRAALHRASQSNKSVLYQGIRLVEPEEGEEEETQGFVEIKVDPLDVGRDKERFYMVAISPYDDLLLPAEVEEIQSAPLEQDVLDHIGVLERELQYTKEHLQTTIEELETTNEELQATNEELIASNEELQSTNEELHSVNEELYTVNSEYQLKINELTKLNNDMKNLQRSSQIRILFLDRFLRIRDFTPEMARTFNLMTHDVGRPVEHLLYNLNMERDELSGYTRSVFDGGPPIKREIESIEGGRFLLQILPYQLETGIIEGIILNLTDISDVKLLEDNLVKSEKRFHALVSHMRRPIIYHDGAGEVIFLNQVAAALLQKDPKEIIGQPLSALVENKEGLVEYLEASNQHQPVPRAVLRLHKGDGTLLDMTLDSHPIFDEVGNLIEYQGIGLLEG